MIRVPRTVGLNGHLHPIDEGLGCGPPATPPSVVSGGIVSKAGLVPEVVLAGSDGSVASVKTGFPQEIKKPYRHQLGNHSHDYWDAVRWLSGSSAGSYRPKNPLKFSRLRTLMKNGSDFGCRRCSSGPRVARPASASGRA